jgi:glycosyltransferase involved in cell wall biosynthesis
MRILRLYLKALCDLAEPEGNVRCISLNDAGAEPAELRRYSSTSFVEWVGCSGSKLKFIGASLRLGRRSELIVCGHIAQLPLAWAASFLNPRLSYFLVAHGIEAWRPFTFLELRALRGARGVLCVSEYTRQQVLKYGRIPTEKASVIPNALDPALGLRPPVRIPGGPPVILSISRLTIADNYKGIDHLIAAMPAVRSRVPGARLRIVGRGDGLPSLQELARKLNVPDGVEFAGFVADSELGDEYARSSLFALPSLKEGFGIVYLEAMANGRPCLGALSGGTPEVISTDTGVLVEYGDVSGLAVAIVDALRRDWSAEAIVERSKMFSYLRFKERLASLISA